MSLRLKVALYMAGSIVVVLGVLFYASRLLVANGFDKLEIASTEQNVRRGTDALNNSLDQLSTKLSDWANWDDAYEYVVHPNQEFADSNLQDTSLQNLKVNYMLFFNSSYKLIKGKAVGSTPSSLASIPTSLMQQLTADNNTLLKAALADEGKKGIVMLPEGPLLLAARPIHNSEGGGPTHGVMIFAQYLAPQAPILATITHLQLTFHADSGKDVPNDVLAAKSALEAKPVMARVVDSHTIAGYGLVKDIQGKSALVARVQEARDIHAQGLKVANYYTLYLGIAAVTVCVGMLVFVNTVIIRRVAGLSQQVASIDTLKGNLTEVSIHGNDELTKLGDSINKMLKRLYDSRFLEERNIKLNEQVADATKALEEERQHLNQQLADAQRINRIMVNRELKMVELKKRLAKYEPASKTDSDTDKLDA